MHYRFPPPSKKLIAEITILRLFLCMVISGWKHIVPSPLLCRSLYAFLSQKSNLALALIKLALLYQDFMENFSSFTRWFIIDNSSMHQSVCIFPLDAFPTYHKMLTLLTLDAYLTYHICLLTLCYYTPQLDMWNFQFHQEDLLGPALKLTDHFIMQIFHLWLKRLWFMIKNVPFGLIYGIFM